MSEAEGRARCWWIWILKKWFDFLYSSWSQLWIKFSLHRLLLQAWILWRSASRHAHSCPAPFITRTCTSYHTLSYSQLFDSSLISVHISANSAASASSHSTSLEEEIKIESQSPLLLKYMTKIFYCVFNPYNMRNTVGKFATLWGLLTMWGTNVRNTLKMLIKWSC